MTRMLFVLLCAFCVSCNQPSQSNEIIKPVEPVTNAPAPVAKNSFATGVIIASVPLHKNPMQSFALYLPKAYTDTDKLPVIIFFDPHGDGTVPLKLYSELADKSGFILVGSNNSKNGLSFDETNQTATDLLNEIKSRLSVNTGKISFCGFSGGAKVALLSGAGLTDVANIIYCGAATEIHPNHPVKLLGFAGTKDMNYTDLVAFESGLGANAPFQHFLVQWQGKHEFPTAEVFKDAFGFINTGTVENYATKKVTITPDKVAVEQNYKQQYIQALQTKDLNWWKNEIASMNIKKKAGDPMFDRLLGFVSLACYSISNNALQQDNLEVAGKILSIYEMADPGNTDCQKFKEIYNQKKGIH